MSEEDDWLVLVPKPSRDVLNQRQTVDYRDHRRQMLSWALTKGKHPGRKEGYAVTTVENRAYRIDQFYRWVWEQEDGYTTHVTHDHANSWVEELAYSSATGSHKNNCLKALRMLFKWRHYQFEEDRWYPKRLFEVGGRNPRDFLTRQERRKIREAALEYGTIPAYNDLSPDERAQWKAYIAQRLSKPKSEVGPADWDKVNGWKIPSLVSISLDTGLRPIEIERARVGWVDLNNGVLRIPPDEASKNQEQWVVPFTDRTKMFLEVWLEERANYEKYEDTELLWLTRFGNPYGSQSLRYILHRLCEIAGIATENRKMSWYTIRHSVGTYMAREEDLAAAQAQLRHRSIFSTVRYDQTPIEDRKDALNRMR